MLELVRHVQALAGWPPAHSRTTRVGRSGESRLLLEAARAFVDDESLNNVELVEDDLFVSALEPASFDLVHARFLLAPLGRFEEQMAVFRRTGKRGRLLVLEDPDMSSWRFNPDAPPGAPVDRTHRAGLSGSRRRLQCREAPARFDRRRRRTECGDRRATTRTSLPPAAAPVCDLSGAGAAELGRAQGA
jgi:hypothetical protein